MSKLKYIALGIGAFFGGRYLLSLSRAGNKIVTTVSGQKDQITAQGIGVKVKYNIKNPTKAKIKLTPPLIKLTVNGKLLASSTMQQVDIPEAVRDEKGRIKIEAFKETGEITSTILVPWLSVIGIGPQLMSRLQSNDPNEKVKIEVETISQIYTKVGDYPYEDKTTIQL